MCLCICAAVDPSVFLGPTKEEDRWGLREAAGRAEQRKSSRFK